MKRFTVFFAAIALLLLSARSAGDPNAGTNSVGDEKVEISLWTYRVGGWGNQATVSSQLASFHKDHPNISVTVKVLDYETGDEEVEESIKNGNAPDLVLEGPERLVANWGARGLMVDIADLWQNESAEEIYDNVEVACHDKSGKYFIYPMCMTTHCMAINRDLFEKAGALQYVDEETHTWTTEGFFNAVEALRAHGVKDVAAVYCGGQGGDQGTRALVTNLYSGTYTDRDHTRYTVDSEQNIRALTKLRDTEGIVFASDMVGTDEIAKFCKGELAMAFCWNVFAEIDQTINKSFDFDILPMAFPTDSGDAELQGGIWGFGIFDNKDEVRVNAAKTFIRYLMQDDARYSSAVNASTYLPVREVADIYLNDKLMNEYSIFGNYLGDYYQVTPNWAQARTAWWQMLQQIGKGDDVAEAVRAFSEKANKDLSLPS